MVTKRVVVIASGETERRALPLLPSHLRDQDIAVEVRVPPRNRRLDVRMAENLIRAAWYEDLSGLPAKFVILVDTDGKAPEDVVAPFKDSLPGRLGDDIEADVLYAYAQWHLEAWYFGDAANLRRFLRGAVGAVDASKPDEIQNPKLHLKNVLGGRVYTARVSEEIAGIMNALTIAERSPSFRGFLEAVTNGSAKVYASGTGKK